ncbi:hypothetical protein Cgig2_020963 [Carnegiea gigantea]|uniref:Uncharacterized protein n=1 Tax=Carnegiea gigantea TaxID=171969 RepID=A0A9Q1JKJ3_9CARY|nr:hypothetical protein Cgig2_020963 [Carnegiea gigantea]
MDGSCGSQRAPLENGDKSSHHPIYRRSSSLKTLTVAPPPDSRITWIRKGKVGKGTFSYSHNDEKSCINVCKGYANFFDAMVLEKFGFDQGVPANTLSFVVSLRKQRNTMDLAQAVATLYRDGTGAKLYIPNVYLKGLCTWNYYNWWARSSTPYLSQSVQKIHQVIVNYKAILTEQIFIIDCLRLNPQSIGGPVRISKIVGNKSPKAQPTRALPKGKGTGASSKEHSIGFSAKGKSAGASSKKGKETVSESNHKS